MTSTDGHSSAGRAAEARRELPFLLAYGLLFAGLSIGTLDSTAITTQAGGRSSGAIWTSIYLATMGISIAAMVPAVPSIAERFGARRAFAASAAVSSVIWTVVACLILGGVRPMPVLLVAAVLAGVSLAVFSVLNPLFARAYFDGEGMAGAVARLSLASGIAWAIGAAAGGFLLNVVAPGWGILIRAVLGVPFAIYVISKPPSAEPLMPESREPVWSGMRDRLRDNRDLRRATLLGCGVTAFAAPMASLIVPIVDALRQSPLLPGAGILSASMAVGEMFAPVVVSKLERRRTDLRAAAVAAIVCGGVLVLYAIGSYALSRRPELAMWAAIGVAYGAFRFASKALNVGAATASDTEENSVESVATLLFVTGLSAPVGLLAWGFLINRWSVEAAVLIGAAATVASAAAVLARSKSDR